jgi:hypothetical protein
LATVAVIRHVNAFVEEFADVAGSFGAHWADNIAICSNCRSDDETRIDDKLAVMLESCGPTQLVTSPTRDDNLLEVPASSNLASISDVQVDDGGLMYVHRLITTHTATRWTVKTVAHGLRYIMAVDTGLLRTRVA